MTLASRGFQVFVKPAGAACNLACRHCYYLDKGPRAANAEPSRMPEDILERYIAQHIAASPDEIVRFSWHGGEPTVLGVDYLIAKDMADPGRVGAMGWSQGGYISAFLATNSTKFKAISDGAGISNWVTYYVNTDIHPFTRHYLKATP